MRGDVSRVLIGLIVALPEAIEYTYESIVVLIISYGTSLGSVRLSKRSCALLFRIFDSSWRRRTQTFGRQRNSM